MSLRSILDQGLQQAKLELPEQMRERLLQYLALMQKWNKVHNLTAVREPQEMVTLHLLDSLSVLPYVRGKSLLDVGSGGGLPGIPLALCLPQLQVTVLDSSQKKTSFMRQVKAELGIPNLQVVCSRVEQFRPEAAFDAVISRAFSELDQFVGLTRHLLASEGCWMAMKGLNPERELAQIALKAEVIPLTVPGLGAQRHLVLLRDSNLGVA